MERTLSLDTYTEYLDAMNAILAGQRKYLDSLQAVEIQSEQEFIGFIRQEQDGRFSNDIWKWGVHYGKQIFGDSIEEVKQKAFEIYG